MYRTYSLIPFISYNSNKSVVRADNQTYSSIPFLLKFDPDEHAKNDHIRVAIFIQYLHVFVGSVKQSLKVYDTTVINMLSHLIYNEFVRTDIHVRLLAGRSQNTWRKLTCPAGEHMVILHSDAGYQTWREATWYYCHNISEISQSAI